MNIHFFLPWWAFALIWFLGAIVIVIVRNVSDSQRGDVCNFMPLFVDLPIILIGLFGAIGIVVGHFL